MALAPVPAENPDRYRYKGWVSVPFVGAQIFAVAAVIYSGWSWSGFALAVALYYARMFFITAGYHRYFSHRTYKTSRAMQFLLALGGTTAAQKGVLWWASHHRTHHKLSDQPGDIHSVRQDGLFYSHMGWIMTDEHEPTDWARIKDFASYPELRWLNRWHLVPPVALAVGLYLVGGWHALLWGFFVSTTLLWHGTFTINSLSHLLGRRRYETTDDSKNNWVLALITMGEGWHNNHHHHQSSANQGFFWWELDLSYLILRAMAAVGLVWDVRRAPAHIVAGDRRTPRLVPLATAVELDRAA
jgi:stearoyl-CoA desaturase (delta-9 desaturase)